VKTNFAPNNYSNYLSGAALGLITVKVPVREEPAQKLQVVAIEPPAKKPIPNQKKKTSHTLYHEMQYVTLCIA